MAGFRELLDELRSRVSRLDQAVQNVLDDIASDDNPHGNLSAAAISSLEHDCVGGCEALAAIDRHLFLHRPELHHCCREQPDTVKRAMARTTFVTYHLLDGAGAASAEDHALVEPTAARLTPGFHRYTPLRMAGRTAAAGRPCWWCWHEPDRRRPADGETYLHELALGRDQREQAAVDGALVEMTVARASLGTGAKVFKPTALEGFCEDTAFRPELRGADHGRTVPAREGLRGWPEAVGCSVSYHDLDEELDIKVEVLSWTSHER